jgi:hypothetical protein
MLLINIFVRSLTLLTVWILTIAISDRDALINAIFPDRTIHVENLPIIKYLQSYSASEYTGMIGIIDFHFNPDDSAFINSAHPGWKRFLVGDANPGLTYPIEYEWDINHGNTVARIMSFILPKARFLCLRLPSPYSKPKIKYKTHAEMQRIESAKYPDPKFVMDSFRDLGVRVVVMSLEVYLTEWLVELSRHALKNGIILVCSSTNSRLPLEKFPGIERIAHMNRLYPGLVLWATTDVIPHVRWNFAAYSNDNIILQYLFATAGVDVFVDLNHIASGSSIAAPILASIIALLMNIFPDYSPKDILYLLTILSTSSAGVLVKSLWEIHDYNLIRSYHLYWIVFNHFICTEIWIEKARFILDLLYFNSMKTLSHWLYYIGAENKINHDSSC